MNTLVVGFTLLATSFCIPVPTAECQQTIGAKANPAAAAVTPSRLEDFLQQAKYREGLEWLRSFGQGTPEENRYRGLFHHGLWQPDPTLQYLVPVYRTHPNDDAVAIAVAEASLWKKDYKTATTVLSQLQARDAPEALRVRGLLFEQAGRLPEALDLYNRAMPHLKLPWGTMERKAQVLSWLKRFDEASAVYMQIVANSEASLGLKQRCRVRMAELIAWKKDLDGALAQLAALLKENPRLVDALLLRARILEWKGDFGEAKRTYSGILAIDSTNAEARLRLDKLLWVK